MSDLQEIHLNHGTLDPVHLRKVADLHIHAIDIGFLSSLGHRALIPFYSIIASSPSSHLITAWMDSKDDSRLVGLICGTTSTRDLYRRLILHRGLRLLPLLPKVIGQQGRQKLWESINYARRNEAGPDLPQAELLNFVVVEDFQGSGLAQRLFDMLTSWFGECGVGEIRIISGANQERAHAFYLKNGARRAGTLEVHEGTPSVAFVYATKEI